MERRLARNPALALSFAFILTAPALAVAAGLPDSDPAQVEWELAHREALEAHLARVAVEGPPRQAYLAANLAGKTSPLALAGSVDANAESRRIDAARDAIARGHDDWILALAEATCDLGGLSAAERAAACDRPAAAERLARLADGNAFAHLTLWQLAVESGDTDEAARQFAAAVRADRYEEPFLAMAGAIRAIYAGVEVPPVPASFEASLAESRLVEGPVTRELIAEMETLGAVFALALPAHQPLLRHCFPGGEASDDEALNAQCMAIYRRMALQSTTLIGQTIANVSLARLSPESTDGRQARERLRELSWLQANQATTVGTRKDAAGWMRFIDALHARGEVQAFREETRRAGLPATPPPGWLPDHAPRADLISHGIYRAN